MELEEKEKVAGNYGLEADMFHVVKVGDIVRGAPIFVPPSATIKEAAKIMHENGKTYVLVADETVKGIITEGDIRRAVALDIPLSKEIDTLISGRLITISKDKTLWDAVIVFFKNSIRHLPVKDNEEITGVISINDIVFYASKVPFYFLEEFTKARDIKEVREIYERFNTYLCEILSRDEYVNPVNLGKIVGFINDQIIKSVIKICIDELGNPPCRFSFFVTGSEGRMEQLLRTDQDNAMIIENESYKDYFIELGKRIHSYLLKVGFPDCRGRYTVGNEKWIMSVKEWLETLKYWESVFTPQNILQLSIFTDMRHVFGDVSLFNLVQGVLFRIGEKKVIFAKMLEESLKFRVPIGFGGRLTVERLDLKKHAIVPTIAPVRALSFGFNVRAKNTVERIDELVAKGAISKDLATNLKASYVFLRRIHFLTQVHNVGKEDININELNLRELPKVRVEFIKNSLKSISEFHKMIEARFL